MGDKGRDLNVFLKDKNGDFIEAKGKGCKVTHKTLKTRFGIEIKETIECENFEVDLSVERLLRSAEKAAKKLEKAESKKAGR